MRRFLRTVTLLLLTGLSTVALAQVLPMRGPLGLGRLLVGTVSKNKPAKKMHSRDSAKRATYTLTSAQGENFKLRGHEAELEKLCGKKVRLTGNAVGNEITVNSVELLKN